MRNKQTRSIKVLIFTFEEHDWIHEITSKKEIEQKMFEIVKAEGWNPMPIDYIEKIDIIEEYCDENINSLEDLENIIIESATMTAFKNPEEIVKILLSKLRNEIKEENKEFVGGTYYEFEGHHNDTEIYVALKKND